MKKLLVYILFVFGLGVAFTATPAKAETTDCTEIPSLPFTITAQGIYCFKHNLVTAITTGNAITINTNNVTIDMNGFKLGGSAAGSGTFASGIYALDRKNITVRNGNIRGFLYGIYLDGFSGSGHLIEFIRADGNTQRGMFIAGTNHIIRNNHVINTGPTDISSFAFGISLSSPSNVVVADNVISGISETNQAYGIHMTSSSKVEIRGNSIFEIKDAPLQYGIYLSGGSDITIIDNRIINPATTGNTGIFGLFSPSGVDCIENTIRGYTTGQTGCVYTSGNHIN